MLMLYYFNADHGKDLCGFYNSRASNPCQGNRCSEDCLQMAPGPTLIVEYGDCVGKMATVAFVVTVEPFANAIDFWLLM